MLHCTKLDVSISYCNEEGQGKRVSQVTTSKSRHNKVLNCPIQEKEDDQLIRGLSINDAADGHNASSNENQERGGRARGLGNI